MAELPAGLSEKLNDGSREKLAALANPKLHGFIADAVELCRPGSVFVCSDSAEDIEFVRRQAVEAGEEVQLAIEGHTCHFDGYNDQARDKANTKYLVPPGMKLGSGLNSVAKDEGLAEVRRLLEGSMKGMTAIVRFFCLGPTDSEFSVLGVQVTDSFYVAHSEDLLYRPGYEQFRGLGESGDFFRVLHSAGELDGGVSANSEGRRIYIDIEDDIVYSVNTQYAGNTVGFKKLSLRLAIRKADREGWLAEHMLVMGVHGPGGRVTYFAGAFPSFCGKTSTAMIPGETIVGDDLAYLRKRGRRVHAANVESGIFGIIRNVTKADDPVIAKILHSPGEVIFSNVLVSNGKPCWLGQGVEPPEEGVNFSGEWHAGKTDDDGNEIPLAHQNARYTIRLRDLANLDPRADDPQGVPVGGIIYGDRDSDTWVPLKEAFDWEHGVIAFGASLESESTAATLGKSGVRSFQPMSNLDFVSLPLGRYVQNHLDFAEGLERPPVIFASNYFIRGASGEYLSGMKDKYVWLKWMELRVNGEAEAVRAPTGLIPRHEDLVRLFGEVLGEEYPEETYAQQFTIRVPESLAKIDRIEKIFRTDVDDAPQAIFDVLSAQRERLEEARAKLGDYISPLDLRE